MGGRGRTKSTKRKGSDLILQFVCFVWDITFSPVQSCHFIQQSMVVLEICEKTALRLVDACGPDVMNLKTNDYQLNMIDRPVVTPVAKFAPTQ